MVRMTGLEASCGLLGVALLSYMNQSSGLVGSEGSRVPYEHNG
jgi:hypothetical protein